MVDGIDGIALMTVRRNVSQVETPFSSISWRKHKETGTSWVTISANFRIL